MRSSCWDIPLPTMQTGSRTGTVGVSGTMRKGHSQRRCPSLCKSQSWPFLALSSHCSAISLMPISTISLGSPRKSSTRCPNGSSRMRRSNVDSSETAGAICRLVTLGPTLTLLGAAGKNRRTAQWTQPNISIRPSSNAVIPAATVHGMAPFSLKTLNIRRHENPFCRNDFAGFFASLTLYSHEDKCVCHTTVL